MGLQKSLCDSCELNNIAPQDRQELCRNLARGIVHQWWHGTALRQLSEVAFDEMFDQALSDAEEEAMYACMAGHSSTRCANMNPYGV